MFRYQNTRVQVPLHHFVTLFISHYQEDIRYLLFVISAVTLGAILDFS
jgi:hypothetical protein